MDMWFNTVDYTYLELTLFITGCFLWVIAYAIIIKNIRKHKVVEMPFLAGCGNFGWEFVWSFIFRTNMGLVCVYAYRAWFFLDIYIFSNLLRYGDKQVSSPEMKQWFKPMCIFLTLAWAIATYTIKTTGYELVIGAISAYTVNVFISGCYISLILRIDSLKGFSLAVAWLKMIGTGLNTIFMIIHFPTNSYLHFMGILVFILDIIYIYLFVKKRKELPTS